ncbi:MAG: PhnD/SsuA/transferrin family substrate-binding protein, partial [Chloroflexota bacterium]
RRWKDGEGEYHTIFFALKDSGITSLEDLQGEVIGFEDSASTSGFMLPLAHLIEAGFAPLEINELEGDIVEDSVNYIFTKDDENTIQWVLSGKVNAGVLDNQSYYMDIPEETRDNLIILAETEVVARQIAMIRPNMDPVLQEAITMALLNASDNEAGQSALETFKTTKFDEFPAGADTVLTRMEQLYELTLQRE